MSEELHEKYAVACGIKDMCLGLVKSKLENDLIEVDAKELGEVADIAKDMAELIKLCIEAEYYYKAIEVMDEHGEEVIETKIV